MELAQSPVAVIRARSERQAMDWALVLASQGIEAIIDRGESGVGWELRMGSAEYSRALQSIHQYRAENRRLRWRQPIPGSNWSFHWGVLMWVAVTLWTFSIQSRLQSGLFASASVSAGEWWRAFTSLWLHQDFVHLTTNLAFGAIFLGLAMGRFGVGLACLGAVAAGALGNVASFSLRTHEYIGLGASGMVAGTIGMLAAQAVPQWHKGTMGARLAGSTLSAGVGLFLLLGTDPSSDVIAHSGGFVAGLVTGASLSAIPKSALRWMNPLAGLTTLGLVGLAWHLALRP